MRPSLALLLLVAIALQTACNSRSASRAEMQSVTSVFVSSSGDKLLLEASEEIEPLVAELNALRQRKWSRGDVLFGCHASVIIYRNQERIAYFRVSGQRIVDRYMNDQQSTNNLTLANGDAPMLKTILSRLSSTAKCR